MADTNADKYIKFTRYLYNWVEVKHSLFISILNKNNDEALFWAYELYYSGFQEDLFEFLFKIYNNVFELLNPELHIYLNKIKNIWEEDNSKDWVVASFIYTLNTREYSIDNFVTTYLNVNCKITNTMISNKPKLCVNLDNSVCEPFQNISNIIPRKVLQHVSKYRICKEYENIFGSFTIPDYNDYLKIFYEDWLYYCKDTPIWLERIQNYNGIIDNENKKIIFKNDNDFEKFYELWNYDTDEQDANVVQNRVGTPNQKQMSIIQFCKKYKANIKLKTIKN